MTILVVCDRVREMRAGGPLLTEGEKGDMEKLVRGMTMRKIRDLIRSSGIRSQVGDWRSALAVLCDGDAQ